jgi:triacylglycerol lipase
MNDPIPNTFDPANARVLCALSAEAYRRPSRKPPAVEDSSLWCEEADTHVHLDRRERDLLVAFRGTADLRNWLTDLDCELIRVGDFRVHRGFYEALQAVELDLDLSLGEGRPRRLWVTGHSLGGALAKLWALWAAGHGHEVAGVYTFGQPRVGDAAFASYYDSVLKARSFRVVHADDIVPRVPWLLGGYRHAGHEVYFPLGGTPRGGVLDSAARYPYHIDLPWTRTLLAGLPALARELGHGKLALLADHHVSRYLALFPARRAEARVSYSYDY